MFAGTIVLFLSALIFAYWFRHTCLLILSTRMDEDYARVVVEANGLTFAEVRERLDAVPLCVGVLERVHTSLDRDYRLVTYLLEHAAGLRPEGYAFEIWMLRLDFRVMNLMYRCMLRVSTGAARRALLEMASILNHLANTMGERASSSASA